MTSLLKAINPLRLWRGREAGTPKKPARGSASRVISPGIDIAPNDPLIAFLVGAPEPVEPSQLHLDTPAVRALREAGVTLIIPLVSQGELMGMLNLGPRLSEQEYSRDDRRLLSDLATQAAPAVRVAQLVREQQSQARERERIEQELRIARIIQQTLLPRELPDLPGWQMAPTISRRARSVATSTISSHCRRRPLALVIGDVTDKGVPAALVMATTRSILRAAAQSAGDRPGKCWSAPMICCTPIFRPRCSSPASMRCWTRQRGVCATRMRDTTCPTTGSAEDVLELRATGMPLGLMPGMRYEEKETSLAPGRQHPLL